MPSGFSTVVLEAENNDVFRILRKNSFQPRILYQTKLSTVRAEYRFLNEQELIHLNSHIAFLMKLLDDVLH